MGLMYILIIFEVVVYLFRLMKSWYHVILLILILEFFRIKRFLLCNMIMISKVRSLFLFFFSVIIVCEARIGIGLIVRLTRGRGDEAIEI